MASVLMSDDISYSTVHGYGRCSAGKRIVAEAGMTSSPSSPKEVTYLAFQFLLNSIAIFVTQAEKLSYL